MSTRSRLPSCPRNTAQTPPRPRKIPLFLLSIRTHREPSNVAFDAQSITTFAAGIAGTLGTIKLIQFVARSRAVDDREAGDESFREHHERLFPNGEKDQIIQRLDELAQQNRDSRKEYLSFRSEVKADLRDIAERLDKAGIL